MKKIKLNLVFLTIYALVAAITPGLVYARGGDDTTSSSSSTSGSDSGSGSSSGSDSQITQKTEAEIKLEDAQKQELQKEQETKAEDGGRAMVNDLLKTKKQHTAEERTKNCQAAKTGLSQKLSNLQKNATKLKTKIDNAYTNALSVQQAKNLNPAGIDQLEATADAAKIKAQASVDALSSLSVNLDCSSGEVAQNVATFKTAATQAKTDLKAYKEAVKAVLQALKTAEGGEQ